MARGLAKSNNNKINVQTCKYQRKSTLKTVKHTYTNISTAAQPNVPPCNYPFSVYLQNDSAKSCVPLCQSQPRYPSVQMTEYKLRALAMQTFLMSLPYCLSSKLFFFIFKRCIIYVSTLFVCTPA